jgi:diguanylate cyclase (GGDEF)-like protein
VTAGPGGTLEADLEAALWRLFAVSGRDDAPAFLRRLAEAEDSLSGAVEPCWLAWRQALAARRALAEEDPEAAENAVAAGREALEKCDRTPHTALTLAYLAHVEVAADRFDAAMLLAVDASLLTEELAGGEPTRPLLHAHLWLARTLAGLDLEELAVAQALRGSRVADRLPSLADRWQLLQLSAQGHAELASTLYRRGETGHSAELARVAIRCATRARELPWEPEPAERGLLDVVQSWAMFCSGPPQEALGPLRSAHRRVQHDGGMWLRGYADLVLARLLVRLVATERDGARAAAHGAEASDLLVDAAGAFASSGDRRRYRQCLLELGQTTATLGRPAEALHWLEAYRTDTGRAHARARELWAEMFVRRSRLREAERQAAVLRRHALEDPLTGLGNRRSAERRLGDLSLGEEPLSLAVVDIDHFKQVNDETSHTSGDTVLRRVAELLRAHSRTGDEVYRWAGDEFLVVLPTASESQAMAVTERLRAAVATADWSDLQLPEPVTVSIGVATAAAAATSGPDTAATQAGWRALFDTADLHLFSAKRAGRNRVRAPGVPPPAAGEAQG